MRPLQTLDPRSWIDRHRKLLEPPLGKRRTCARRAGALERAG
jgi:hypothetical protein